jgi:hypothetical protein
MTQLTPDGRRLVEEIAARHHVSADAAITAFRALVAGQGSQAQFSHPELGGMGQWARGGMVMVGDMFNTALKARVDALCTDLAALIDRSDPLIRPSQSQGQSQGGPGVSLFVPGRGSDWWPADLGTPASVGAQNDMRYAYFPATRRLAIEVGGRMSLHDTGDRRISGVSQQQGPGQSITFTSQHGLVRVADLPRVQADQVQPTPPHPEPGGVTESPRVPDPVSEEGRAGPAAGPSRPASEDDIFAKIERLADLRRKDILTEDEYTAKKAELLSRL